MTLEELEPYLTKITGLYFEKGNGAWAFSPKAITVINKEITEAKKELIDFINEKKAEA